MLSIIIGIAAFLFLAYWLVQLDNQLTSAEKALEQASREMDRLRSQANAVEAQASNRLDYLRSEIVRLSSEVHGLQQTPEAKSRNAAMAALNELIRR